MIFTTWPFLVFMVLVFAAYWWLTPARWRRGFLLLASLVYFTYNYAAHTLLLGGLTLAVYGLGALIVACRGQSAAQGRERFWLIVGLLLCAGTLCFFKYSRMLEGIANGLIHEMDYDAALPVPRFLVPLGISF